MATRTSTRLKANAAVATTKLGQNEAQAQGNRNLKRQKISHVSSDIATASKSNRRGIKRKTGCSSFSKDVPLDILFEIFKLLQPIDLLYLSRVSKSLHALVSSNDMVSIWRIVYENIEGPEPPSCPDDINVVFYTNYLYGRHCQFCGSIYGQICHDSALIRLCSKCVDDGFLDVDGLDPPVRCLCNVSTIRKRRRARRVVLKVEYDLRTKELNHAHENKEEKIYSTNRKVDVKNRASLSRLLCEWREEILEIQGRRLELIRATREKDIRKKLEEEGYQDDLDFNRCWLYLVPHVRKSHALTDSEWRIIRADILDYFQDSRDYQVRYQIHDVLSTRIKYLQDFIKQWKIRPTAWWIVTSSEPIASFIKSQLGDQLSFEKFKPQLRNLIASWKEETDRYLTSLISDEEKQNKTNRLKLATTFFRCRYCEELIAYPDILMHDCFFSEDDESGNDNEGDSDGNVVVKTRKPRGPREPRPPKHITADMVLPMLSSSHSLGMCVGRGVSYDDEAFVAACNIITACGEDPNTVTRDTMKKVSLECMHCGGDRVAMRWSKALLHELGYHKGEYTPSGPSWRKIEGSGNKKAKKRV